MMTSSLAAARSAISSLVALAGLSASLALSTMKVTAAIFRSR